MLFVQNFLDIENYFKLNNKQEKNLTCIGFHGNWWRSKTIFTRSRFDGVILAYKHTVSIDNLRNTAILLQLLYVSFYQTYDVRHPTRVTDRHFYSFLSTDRYVRFLIVAKQMSRDKFFPSQMEKKRLLKSVTRKHNIGNSQLSDIGQKET